MKRGRISPSEAGHALAGAVSNMGPLYIKLAQFISARKDALDPAFADALAAVQDDIAVQDDAAPPAIDGYEVDPRPIARASIADVFRGRRTSDGAAVAIKRRRSGVKSTMTTDLPLLAGVMGVCGALGIPGAQNMHELIMQSWAMVVNELDFRNEAASIEEFRGLFADVEWVLLPRVWHASETVMIMEFLPARKLRDVRGPNPALARRVMDLYMMMLTSGLMHADPHPGNLGFCADGTVVLYDFGAMLRVDVATKEHVTQALQAGVTRDPGRMLAALENLGVLTVQPGQRSAVRRLVRRVLNGDVHAELRDAPEFASRNQRIVKFSTEFIYITRTLTLIDGICRTLDPDFEYEYARWVDAPNGLDTAMEVMQHAASLPSAVTTMQLDLEEFQMRMVQDISFFKHASIVISLALSVLAVYGGLGR